MLRLLKNHYHCSMPQKVYCFFLCLLFGAFMANAQIQTGAERSQLYLPELQNKRIALVVNQTSTIGSTHLVDSLLRLKVNIGVLFAPEHGFRGHASAGTTVQNGVDEKTGLKIISLYGSHKKPTAADLNNIDLIVFDIQDVGVRFYTYISTMHYMMEAGAENHIPVMVLDRPNPNGHYVDGPVLDTLFRSFVGMHPIPLVHGCTVGELAKMINGQGWLKGGKVCDLKVIPCANYTHQTPYVLPIKPSPNLQTQSAIYLYPSLGLFEGTVMSIGQGTNKPYQCFGSPAMDWGNWQFTPVSIPGVAEKPKFQGLPCTGFDLSDYGFNKAYSASRINLDWLIMSYQLSKNKPAFFNDFIDKLAGTSKLRQQIIAGQTAESIRNSWQNELKTYNTMRKEYLLYP
ncbi:MAG: hypothetical protein RLZZ60_840 [Bacteroidota bacterium]